MSTQRRQVKQKTANSFHGFYDDYEIIIVREPKECARKFYITVTAPDGCYAYDGWWGEEWNTIHDAIEQALKGSCLVDEECGVPNAAAK